MFDKTPGNQIKAMISGNLTRWLKSKNPETQEKGKDVVAAVISNPEVIKTLEAEGYIIKKKSKDHDPNSEEAVITSKVASGEPGGGDAAPLGDGQTVSSLGEFRATINTLTETFKVMESFRDSLAKDLILPAQKDPDQEMESEILKQFVPVVANMFKGASK